MNDGSRLFELPWEIRERIYEYYLSFDHNDFGDTLRPLHLYIEQGGYSKPIPPLMLTCKRGYRELHQRVHSDALMRVHTAGWGDRRIGFAVHGTLRFERLRRLYILVAMEYPNWNRWLGMFGEVARRAKNLSELVVDWEPRPNSTKGWEAKLTEKKYDEFFGIVSDLKNLQVVRFHGVMPSGWRERFEKETTARLDPNIVIVLKRTRHTMAANTAEETLLVIGAGPLIGRSVTALFASKRYTKIALIARREEQLRLEKKAVEEAAPSATVKTYAVDITDTEAFSKVLEKADAEIGKPSCVFFNAARVAPSEMLALDVKEIEYDFKINVSALYATAQRYVPHLTSLAKSSPESTPAIIVTSSLLPSEPIPAVFSLSLVKAAQRNFVQTLRMSYENEGVYIGLINVGGPVSHDHEVWNPDNIAKKSWEWFSQIKDKPSFEVKI
ncbi:short-chain dehydrogenase reductase sdr [Colletotrichum karsti]|uniref:Short-chain dehydrogenase reductase sdr n=1 Tax=Colletotrichum karsti TaxID=1095194 RepID=A0A9P6LL67_9PEZI|nr:short-chain dehydrogenase reductase sdr [Colletotrichum karsti]KAF9876885.1 short-chain dehydrogenase reductase sdr [Colletotrichum karsti]